MGLWVRVVQSDGSEAPEGGAALLSSLGTHLTDDRDTSEWLLLEAMVASRAAKSVSDSRLTIMASTSASE